MNSNASSRTPRPDLHEPGAVLLVSCYELGHRPLGITTALSFLERAGFQPDSLDISVERLDPRKIERAGFIGFAVPMHTALRLAVPAARRARAIQPHAHIAFFGLYAALNAEYLLREVCDSVTGGECEEALVRWIETLAREQRARDSVAGRSAGDVSAVEGIRLRDRDAAPVVRKISFGPSKTWLASPAPYARLERGGEAVPAGAVEASRGCLHACRHCPIPSVYGGRFFVVPRATVLREIRDQVAAGAGHITFADPDFLNGPGHSLAIVRAMHAEHPRVTFDFTAKIEHILEQRALLPELGASGCAFAISAVESLSDTVLAMLRKGHTRRDTAQALHLLRDAGIPLRPSWLPFTPWSTIGDFIEMLDFVDAEGLIEHIDPVQYTIRLLIPPGSLLLEEPSLGPLLGPLAEEAFLHPWMHPDPRMDRLHLELGEMVEEAARTGEKAAETFERIRRHVFGAAGMTPPPPRTLGRRGESVPRLTESWFC